MFTLGLFAHLTSFLFDFGVMLSCYERLPHFLYLLIKATGLVLRCLFDLIIFIYLRRLNISFCSIKWCHRIHQHHHLKIHPRNIIYYVLDTFLDQFLNLLTILNFCYSLFFYSFLIFININIFICIYRILMI